MKIAFVLFTYSLDAGLLRYALNAIERIRAVSSHDITVHLFDDAASPMDKIPQGNYFYEQTAFNRGANLTCFDSIQGQLECYRKAAEAVLADWVVKMDCDTMMTGLEWLTGNMNPPSSENQPGMIGCCPFANITHVCGFYYAINPKILDKMIELVQQEDLKVRILKGAQYEDKILTHISAMVLPNRVILNPTNRPGFWNAGCQWFAEHVQTQYEKHPMEDYLASSAVTFKRFGKTDAIRLEALGGMEAFWALLSAAPYVEKAENPGQEKPIKAVRAPDEHTILLSKEKICQKIDALGKTAAFFTWLQSSAEVFCGWTEAGGTLLYNPVAHDSILAGLLEVLGITPEQAEGIIQELRV